MTRDTAKAVKSSRSASERVELVRFHILGPVRMHVQGRAARIGATKVRGLLGILLLSANNSVSINNLTDRLWDEPASDGTAKRAVKGRDLPPDPRNAVQIYKARLKTALKQAGSPATLHSEHGAYRLALDPETVDYHRFRMFAAEGRRAARDGNQDKASAAFGAAVALWGGPPLADLNTTWARAQRDTLTNRDLLPAYYGLLDSYLALGRGELVLERLHRLLPEHDTDETLAGQWMRAVAAINGPDMLPGFFRTFTEHLRAVLDTDPGERLVRLYESLIRHEQVPPPAGAISVSRPPPPRQLPRPSPFFTGREEILSELDRLVLGAIAPPIIAIDGPPGIGKTALVAAWASGNSFPDGDFVADLGGYGPTEPVAPATVLAALLNALDIPPDRTPPDSEDRARLLRQLLASRRMLIVLDNARDSDHVRPILAATTPCTVLITSRQQLTGLVHRDGAHRITLSRLSPSDSVTVLSRRIGTDRTRRDQAAIADLAALCDGLPLGLRITAEHVAARPNAPVRDLADQLHRQRQILLDAGTAGDDQTVTLRAVFSCSYTALPPEARRLFRLLGLLPGMDFSLSAAAALAASTLRETRQILEVLLGANLVEQHAADRFKLHDLLRLFSAELISNKHPEIHSATHRVLDWYLGTTINAARKIDPHRVEIPQLPLTSGITSHSFLDTAEALQWCIAERKNILSTIRFASTHEFHQHTWRLMGEFDDLLQRWGDPGELVDIHHLALLSARSGNSEEGTREGEAGTLNNLGFTYFYMKDYERAAYYLEQSQLIYRGLNDLYGEAASLTNIATTYTARGEFRAAIDLYWRSIALFEKADNKVGIAAAHQRLGDAYRKIDRYDSAGDCYHKALRLRQELDHRGQADTLTALGELHFARGDVVTAIGYLESAIKFHRQALDERRTAEALETLAEAYCRISRHSDAIAPASESAQRYQMINEPSGRGRSLSILAEAYNAIGETSAARTHWSEALVLLRGLNDPRADAVQHHLERLDTAPNPIPEPRTTTPSPEGDTADRPEPATRPTTRSGQPPDRWSERLR